MEVLVSMLQKQASLPRSGFVIEISAMAPRLRCLFFANDNVFFCKADRQTALALKKFLIAFVLSRAN